MRIPKRDVIEFVIKSVLRGRPVRSQKEFMLLVSAELRKVDPEYSVTGRRLREVASLMPGVKVDVSTRRGGVPSRCPACSSALRNVWTKNLKGRKVLLGIACQKCGFRGSSGSWAPARYVFRRV